MTPLMKYLIVFIVLVAIAVGIYYATREDNSPSPGNLTVKWVAVGDDLPGGTSFGNVMYSVDGKVWQESTGASFSNLGYKVAYGTSDRTNPLLVAVGDDNGGNGSIMYSEDGKFWKESTGMSFADSGNGIAYGTSNGTSPLWVAVGWDEEEYGSLMYSEDGKVWQKGSGICFDRGGFGVAYGTSNGTSPLWVAVGQDFNPLSIPGGAVLYSEDGKEWLRASGPDDIFAETRMSAVAYGTSDGTSPLWVAVGDENIDPARVYYSVNGKEWQRSTTGASFSNRAYDVAYGTSDGTNPLWVAVGNDTVGNGTIKYSDNGVFWTNSTGVSFTGSGRGIAYGTRDGAPLWIAVGGDSVNISKTLFSTDGKEWQELEDGNIFSVIGIGVAFNSILPNVPGFY